MCMYYLQKKGYHKYMITTSERVNRYLCKCIILEMGKTHMSLNQKKDLNDP